MLLSQNLWLLLLCDFSFNDTILCEWMITNSGTLINCIDFVSWINTFLRHFNEMDFYEVWKGLSLHGLHDSIWSHNRMRIYCCKTSAELVSQEYNLLELPEVEAGKTQLSSPWDSTWFDNAQRECRSADQTEQRVTHTDILFGDLGVLEQQLNKQTARELCKVQWLVLCMVLACLFWSVSSQ